MLPPQLSRRRQSTGQQRPASQPSQPTAPTVRFQMARCPGSKLPQPPHAAKQPRSYTVSPTIKSILSISPARKADRLNNRRRGRMRCTHRCVKERKAPAHTRSQAESPGSGVAPCGTWSLTRLGGSGVPTPVRKDRTAARCVRRSGV